MQLIANVGNRINSFFSNLNLRKKFILLHFAVVVVPVIIVGLIAENLMFNYLQKDYGITVNEAVDQLIKNIEFRKLSYELLVTRTATDGELAARLTQKYTDFYSEWETVNYIDRSFGMVREYLPGISAFRIYHENDTLIQDGGVLWKPEGRMLAGMNEDQWYESVAGGSLPMEWGLVMDPANDQLNLTLSRKINWISNQETIGCIFLQIQTSQVFSNLIDTAFHGKGDVLLFNEKGVIFSSSRTDLIGKNIADTPLKNIMLTGNDANSVIEIEGSKSIVVSKPASNNWHIVAAVPLKSLEEGTKTISVWIIGITLCLVFLSIVMMLAVISNIVKRLRRLGNRMTAITKGKFDVAVTKYYSDELGDLEEGFNVMASRLGTLTNEIAVTRSREREEALNALQAQINPHFLYNTLGIIRWKALDMNDDELLQLVDAITVFYRLSLNKGSSVLHINEELNHVKAYLQIQQFRYMNNVTVNWSIDPSILKLYTIKLILQPIVENCYLHGMIAKGGNGVLDISARREGGNVLFVIKDNGAGIPEDVIQKINTNGNTANSGYGLLNIKERLRLYFGDRAKLTIESELGEGTTVSIAIPVCEEPPRLREADLYAQGNDS